LAGQPGRCGRASIAAKIHNGSQHIEIKIENDDR